MIISLPVHTAVCPYRPEGGLLVLVSVQLFVTGLYLPPLLKRLKGLLSPFHPPQMIISLPVHTAVWLFRPAGALVVLVAVQLSVTGLYLPPVLSAFPPQTIISVPVQTAVWPDRAKGAPAVLVSIQVSVAGLYLPPVFKLNKPSRVPPQTIISVPV